MALFSLIIRSKLLLNISQPLKEYFSLPGWFCNKTFSSHSLLLHTLEAIILSMQKNIQRIFLIRWIFQNMTRIARKIRSLTLSPRFRLHLLADFFRTTFTRCSLFLISTATTAGATMPRNCPHRSTFGLINKLISYHQRLHKVLIATLLFADLRQHRLPCAVMSGRVAISGSEWNSAFPASVEWI